MFFFLIIIVIDALTGYYLNEQFSLFCDACAFYAFALCAKRLNKYSIRNENTLAMFCYFCP